MASITEQYTDRLESAANMADSAIAEIDDVLFEVLRARARGEEDLKPLEKRLQQSRRALDKARHTLRKSPGDIELD